MAEVCCFCGRFFKLSLKSVKKISANRYELEVDVDKTEFEEGLSAAYKKTGKRYSVPGFRKGHAPRSVIEKRYGKGVFYEEAVNSLCPKSLDAAVVESGLEMVQDKIDFNLEKIDDGGFTFKAVLTVKPEVEISGYEKLEIDPFLEKVTDKDIEDRLSEIQKEHVKLVTVENRACQKDDTVTIDFTGKVNGKIFKGGTAKNYSLKLGSGSTIEGFEDGILGHKTEETFDVTVTFPEGYHEKKLSGEVAVFTVTLHEIKEPKLPELTDDFAKEVSSCFTLEELKNETKETLEKELESEKEEDLNLQLIEKVCELLKSDIPEAMYVNRSNENLKNLRADYMAHRVGWKEVLEFTKVSPDTKKDKCRELAEQQVKLGLALEAIAKKEDLAPSEEKIEEEYKKLAQIYKVDLEEIKKRVKKEALVHDLSCLMAFDFIKERCVVKGENKGEGAVDNKSNEDDETGKSKKTESAQ